MEFLGTVPELLGMGVPHTGPQIAPSVLDQMVLVGAGQSVVATGGPNIAHTWFLGLLPHLTTLIVCAHHGWLGRLLGGWHSGPRSILSLRKSCAFLRNIQSQTSPNPDKSLKSTTVSYHRLTFFNLFLPLKLDINPSSLAEGQGKLNWSSHLVLPGARGALLLRGQGVVAEPLRLCLCEQASNPSN